MHVCPVEMGIFRGDYPGVISKNFNKGSSRCNVIRWVWPNCSHAHVFKDGDKNSI